MNFPDERVAEVCRLGPIKAAELLEKARAGDQAALYDWAVNADYAKMVRAGAIPAAALRHLRNLLAGVDLEVSIPNG